MSRLLDVHNFVAEKLAWHLRIMSDASLSLAAKSAGSLMLHDLNASQGGAWRGQESMAEKLGISSRQVRRALAELKAASYLKVEIGKGRGRTNIYRATIPEGQSEPGSSSENRTPVSSHSEQNRTAVSSHCEQNRTPVSCNAEQNRTGTVKKEDADVRQFLDEPITSPLPPKRDRRRPDAQTEPSLRPRFRDEDVRRAVVFAIGKDAVASYLDPAAWDPATRQVVCKLDFGYRRLKERAGKTLSEMGIGIILDGRLFDRLPRPILPLDEAA